MNDDQNAIAFTTVGELIAALASFPPEATIGIKAACCSHAHSAVVRAQNEDDWVDEAQVVIDAN